MTLMFCSFDAAPRIMRFFCTGRVIEWDDREFDSWLAKMGNKKILGARAVIVLDVFKVGAKSDELVCWQKIWNSNTIHRCKLRAGSVSPSW